MHSILRNKFNQGAGDLKGEDRKRKKGYVSFQNFNEVEEGDRHQRGVLLRARLKKEKDSFKKYTKEMAGIPERGHAYMTDRNNVSRIVALATGSFPFRMNLFNFHNVVARLPNVNFVPNPNSTRESLNALIAAKIPFQDIAGSS